MTQTAIQKAFAPFKKFLPAWAYNPIRSVATAIIGPILFAYRTGYWRSAFKMAAVSKRGKPLPWYTYPSIEFLNYRNYEDKVILEFGGGQSTLWWADKAKHVVTLEGNEQWYAKIKKRIPENVELIFVSVESNEVNVAQVKEFLETGHYTKFDVIIIDGLYRYEMIDIAVSVVRDNGIIVCDDTEHYGFYEGFKERGLSRVDFFGNAPGVVLPRCTSIYFKDSSFVFDPKYPIPVIAKEA